MGVKYIFATLDFLVQRMLAKQDWEEVHNPDEADVFVFTGGADINPALYGEPEHPFTSCNDFRDQHDLEMFSANTKGKLNIGICRGAQFLCAMSGGKLWQDVDKHCGGDNPHPIFFRRRNEKGDFKLYRIDVTSTHHQMMRPPAGAEVWGWTQRATHRDTGSEFERKVITSEGPDVEIAYMPTTHSLCFQPHPEYACMETNRLFWECVERAFEKRSTA